MTDIAPMVLSTIVCDRVLLDAPTKTSSLIGIRDTIFAPKYPIKCPQLFFFAELTNGHNASKMTLKVVDTNNDDRVLIERTMPIKFPDVKSIVSMVMAFEGPVFEHPGEYCFQLYSDSKLIASRRLICVLVKRQQKNGKAQS